MSEWFRILAARSLGERLMRSNTLVKARVVCAQMHRPDQHRDVFEGYQVIRLIDDCRSMAGDLVCQPATCQTAEITQMDLCRQG